jgi:hypothetical protein
VRQVKEGYLLGITPSFSSSPLLLYMAEAETFEIKRERERERERERAG